MRKQLSMIVLAGGRSSRMGRDKSDLVYQDQTFLNIQLQKGRQLGIRDILVSGYRGQNCEERVVMDRLKGRGPLGGLEACLRLAAYSRCLVLSVDTPLITVQELERLITEDERSRRQAAAENKNGPLITVLQHGEKQEPLIGIYASGLADAIAEALEQGSGSVFAFLRKTGYGVYASQGEEAQFENINEQTDYQQLMFRAGL